MGTWNTNTITDRINVRRRLLRAILVADLMVLGAVGGFLAWANWPARSIAAIVTPPQDTARAAGDGGPIVGKSTPDSR